MSLQDNFRKAMRSYIYSVSVMSNVDENKKFSAITVSSVTSVSLDPPSLLVCINKSAGIHNAIIKIKKIFLIYAVHLRPKVIDLIVLTGI
jgi:flavin reductase